MGVEDSKTCAISKHQDEDGKDCLWCSMIISAIRQVARFKSHSRNVLRFRLKKRRSCTLPRYEWRQFEVEVLRASKIAMIMTPKGPVVDLVLKVFDFTGTQL